MRTVLVITILFLAALTPAQKPAPSPAEPETTVSAKEQAALVKIATNFARDMQRTRDVRPLIARYYYPNIASWWEMFRDGITIGKYEGANPSETGRLYRAETNMFYLMNVGAAISNDDEFQRRIENLVNMISPADMPREKLLPALREWETAYRRALPHIRRKNVEGTQRYKEYLKQSTCNFTVERLEMTLDEDEFSKAFRKWFPTTTQMYKVQTPIGLALVFVKHRNTFKLIGTGPCPWD